MINSRFFIFPILLSSVLSLAQSRFTDSLALVDLYNSTNGLDWNLTKDLEFWSGVVVVNNRVNRVNITSKNITGSIPTTIENLTELEYFQAGDNHLTGSIPSSIGKLINLKRLNLGTNQLVDSIPSSIGNLANLVQLTLSINQLSGPIPSSLGNLTNLQRLQLDRNQLSGSIPPSLGNLTNLNEGLQLDRNQLIGPIPGSLGNLTKLPVMTLWGNQLEGPIPISFGNLTDIQYLGLNDNLLAGPIPSSLGNLTNLQYLLLDLNQLTGSIPSSLGALPNLIILYLQNNNLSGCLPESLLNHCEIDFRISDNPQLPNGGDIAKFCADSIGICPPSPDFQLEHLHFLPKNYILRDKELLQSSTSDEPENYYVCADGSQASLFVMTSLEQGTNISNYHLRIREDPNNQNIEEYGQLIVDEDDPSKYIYRHPNYVSPTVIPGVSRTINVEIYDHVLNIAVGQFKLGIYKAPVVLIHGQWTGSLFRWQTNQALGAFDDVINKLISESGYSPILIHAQNYYSTSSESVLNNRGVVTSGITTVIQRLRNAKISAGKVDLIYHSFGGLLSRYYLSSSAYRDDIHKLIAINSPHSGSQAANLLFDVPQPSLEWQIYQNLGRRAMCNDLDNQSKGGAPFRCNLNCPGTIQDLRVNSNIISALREHGNSNIVPTHAIVTSTTIASGLAYLHGQKGPLSWALIPFYAAGGNIGSHIVGPLFNGEKNDLAVPLSSQIGGLDKYTEFSLVQHCEVLEDQEVLNHICNLLDSSPNDNLFTKTGFHPPQLEYIPDFNNSSRSVTMSDTVEVEIILPIDSLILNPGDTLFIEANSHSATNMLTTVLNRGQLLSIHNVDSSSISFNILIDINTFDWCDIIVTSYDSVARRSGYSSVRVFVDNQIPFDSMELISSDLLLEQDNKSSVEVLGWRKGHQSVITEIDTIQYQFGNDFASYISPGIIQADSIGTDSLYVRLGSLVSRKVPIMITESPPNGQYCENAIELYSNGFADGEGPSQGNGCYNCADAVHSNWYSFTAKNDGIISVSSCNSNLNTRLWIYTGNCDNLNLITGSDDDCNLSSSISELCVKADSTYYFEWDDRWSGEAFMFEFEFTPFDSTTVSTSDDSGNGSLRSVIHNAQMDTIWLSQCLDGDTIQLDSSITISKNIVVVTDPMQDISVSGSPSQSVFKVTNGTELYLKGMILLSDHNLIFDNEGEIVLEDVDIYFSEEINLTGGVYRVSKNCTFYRME